MVALLTVIPMSAALAQDQGTITFTGGGWGHSVGMSQYGAEGMARKGASYTDILTHYYSGVAVSPVSGIPDLKVGIAQNAGQAVVSTIDGTSEVRFTNGTPIASVAAGKYVTVSIEPSGTTCSLLITDLPPWSGLTCDLDVVRIDAASKIVVGTRTVNRGLVFIRKVGNGFHLGAQMDLEDYLRGIAEIPNSWKPATQRAQAVAARSYAIATALERRSNPDYWWNLCACDLRAGPVDQNWEAYTSEIARPNFVQGVTDTAGQAIVRSGTSTALKAYYSSSTFGQTEPNEIGFGGNPVDYLRGVDDHWAVDGTVSNPFATWTRKMALTAIAPRLGFDTIETATAVASSPTTGAITKIRFTGRINGALTTKDFLTRDLRTSSLLGSTTLGCGSTVTCFPSLQVTGVTVTFVGEQTVLQDPSTGIWHMRSDAGAVSTFYYGNPGDTAFMGDWDCNGTKTPGLYRRSDGYVYLRNSNTQGVADIKYFFGNPSDIPLAGDFDGDGCDTVSLYRPSEARFYIINRLGTGDQGLGPADYSFLFGNPGDVPVVGDWNGNNTDSIGLRRPSNGFVYLRNTNTQGVADVSYFFGDAGDLVFAGDWDDDGIDTIGLFRPSTATVYLKNTHTTGSADVTYGMGTSKLKPAGSWAG